MFANYPKLPSFDNNEIMYCVRITPNDIGIYTNREKYIANMFGFEHFIPVKNTGIKTGNFGYWIIGIV